MSNDDRDALDAAQAANTASNKRADAALTEMARLSDLSAESRKADDDRRSADDDRRTADDGRRDADDVRRAADDERRKPTPALDPETTLPTDI